MVAHALPLEVWHMIVELLLLTDLTEFHQALGATNPALSSLLSAIAIRRLYSLFTSSNPTLNPRIRSCCRFNPQLDEPDDACPREKPFLTIEYATLYEPFQVVKDLISRRTIVPTCNGTWNLIFSARDCLECDFIVPYSSQGFGPFAEPVDVSSVELCLIPAHDECPEFGRDKVKLLLQSSKALAESSVHDICLSPTALVRTITSALSVKACLCLDAAGERECRVPSIWLSAIFNPHIYISVDLMKYPMSPGTPREWTEGFAYLEAVTLTMSLRGLPYEGRLLDHEKSTVYSTKLPQQDHF
jgi:hypothetical protein